MEFLTHLGIEAMPVLAPFLTDRVDPSSQRGVELRHVVGLLRSLYDRTARTVQATELKGPPKRVLALGETS